MCTAMFVSILRIEVHNAIKGKAFPSALGNGHRPNVALILLLMIRSTSIKVRKRPVFITFLAKKSALATQGRICMCLFKGGMKP